MIVETGFAKVNLALHVRRRRADGYHEIESLFAFCTDGDVLAGTVREDGALTLRVEGPFAAGLDAGEGNLVLRAARALREGAGCTAGADLVLTKTLPVAAGIGGGSADAAATLRLLTRLWGVRPFDVSLFEIAAGLGADVPACLGSQTVFGSGTGERLTAAEVDVAGLPVLLVNPGVACPTGPVFKAWDGVDRGPLAPGDWRGGRNDLEGPAMAMVPEIAAVLAALRHVPGVTFARMSGSGATCFALFETDFARDSAARLLGGAHPAWWIVGSSFR